MEATREAALEIVYLTLDMVTPFLIDHMTWSTVSFRVSPHAILDPLLLIQLASDVLIAIVAALLLLQSRDKVPFPP